MLFAPPPRLASVILETRGSAPKRGELFVKRVVAVLGVQPAAAPDAEVVRKLGEANDALTAEHARELELTKQLQKAAERASLFIWLKRDDDGWYEDGRTLAE